MKIDQKTTNISSYLSILMVVLYPCLFVFFLNIERSKIVDILGVVGLFLIIAIFIFFSSRLFLRDLHKAAFITNIILILIQNFAIIEKGITLVLPRLQYWHVLILMICVIGNFGMLLRGVFDKGKFSSINIIFLIVFGGLSLFNAVLAVPKIYRLISEKRGVSDMDIALSTKEDFANVYYFIFDEYGGLDCLERYCGFDNSSFYNSLEKLGFNVSKNSRNSTYQSSVEIPNLLNLDIVNNEHMTHESAVAALEKPYLFRLFKENGYQLNIFHSQISYMPIDVSMSNYTFEEKKGVTEDTLQYYIIQKSLFHPITQPSSGKQISEINNMFRYAAQSSRLQSSNLFTFGYFYFPHLPWFVDEFGNRIPVTESNNWRNSDAYLGQLRYSNTKILEIAEEIISRDPRSIIIIQSDHGYRQPIFLEKEYGEKIDDMDAEIKYMLSILNAVYYKGEKIEIESLSGLDTLRVVINQLFGLELDMLGSRSQ